MSTLSPTASGTASTGTDRSTSPPALTRHPEVEIVIPVFNERHVLAASVRTLHDHLRSEHAFTFALTIADNASTDGTLAIAESLARELAEVRVLHLDAKGRGRALRAAWGGSHADVLAYMDVDLSTDLAALSGLLTPLLEGHGDITIGTRLAPASRVTRSIKRELISRAYNLLLHVLLGAAFSDAQCGFKAGRREAIQKLLPAVEDEDWFFDTELLYLAQRAKLAIREVPVRWVEDPDSRVEILAAARQDLRGVMRLRRHFSGRSSAREVQPGKASPARAVVAPFR
jgi:glycosyltransferase involved in cell wall biosynthesis